MKNPLFHSKQLLKSCTVAFTALLLCTTSIFAESFTFDWPTTSSAFPEWMDAPSTTSRALLTALHIPISPIDEEDTELAMTVFFAEPEDGFIRVIWTSATGETMLSRNLLTGVGLPHKHTLLIPNTIMRSAGVLTIESSEAILPIYRVRLEWVSPNEILAAEDAPIPELIGSDGNTTDLVELLGEPYTPTTSEWTRDVVSAPLTDRIERIESGVEFAFELDSTPLQARLAVWLTGPKVAAAVKVFVNGNEAGTLAINVPSLTDEGYYQDQANDWRYAGWRKGVIALPESLLIAGENLLHFEWDEMEYETPFTVKDMILQLRYLWEEESEIPTEDEDALPHGTLGPMLEFKVSDPLLIDSQM